MMLLSTTKEVIIRQTKTLCQKCYPYRYVHNYNSIHSSLYISSLYQLLNRNQYWNQHQWNGNESRRVLVTVNGNNMTHNSHYNYKKIISFCRNRNHQNNLINTRKHSTNIHSSNTSSNHHHHQKIIPAKLHQILSHEIHRLHHLRNVGVFAHVDAGKTTVTERMLALAGIVQRAGSVDTGNTVTDYLPAERERGITIQSAAISFDWKWHNKNSISHSNSHSNSSSSSSSDIDTSDNDEVTIQLIDTPGHVDFSVEVNRSVAVLDGAVLVIDAVAGVQAQTETVWRAMTEPTSMNHHHTGLEGTKTTNNNDTTTTTTSGSSRGRKKYGHEPLPCVAFINKMDKEGCNFGYALSTLKHKLPNANPVAIQIPLFQVGNSSKRGKETSNKIDATIIAVPASDLSMNSVLNGQFVGVIDLIEMRAIIWPHIESSIVSIVEECVPNVINLMNDDEELIDPESHVAKTALEARKDLVAALADFDEEMEECYLMEEDPSNSMIRSALRKATLSRKILPVMTGAALRGKGVEPLLDAVADFLPSPLERLPPSLLEQELITDNKTNKRGKQKLQDDNISSDKIPFGHPLHPSLLAFAFKVVHMKNKGSGDGRVVFVRVYSGQLSTKDTLKVISPSVIGDIPEKPRMERVGGMLELAGGQFSNLTEGISFSGDVCALVGLKSVVTGDTLLLASEHGSGKKNKKIKGGQADNADFDMNIGEHVYLAGVAAPKPVLTVRVEAESAEQQAKLSDALKLLTAEDPSLTVEETESVTLISGLGELHIEVIVDRLQREFGLPVWIGKPAVAYRETVHSSIDSGGLIEYERTIGAMKLQASVHLQIEPIKGPDARNTDSASMVLHDPIVTIGSKVKEYLQVDEELSEEELSQSNDIVNALLAGCKGALTRGPVGSYGMANVKCHVVDISAEGGISYLNTTPGALRAAASSILTSTLIENKLSCSLLEPTMSVEITAPTDMVGTILSDLTSRRGTVGEVFMGDNESETSLKSTKALIHGEVPLVEILGYANTLRSITAGEGTFTAEYVGHSTCDTSNTSFQK